MIRIPSLLTSVLALFVFGNVAQGAPIEAQQSKATNSMIASVREQGRLKVAVSLFVPWAMSSRNGGLSGYNIDIVNRLAKDVGVKPEWILLPWEDAIAALRSGKVDIISGMTITTLRNLQVNFTIPYAHTRVQIVANRQLAKGLNTIQAYDRKEVTLALRKGSTAVDIAQSVLSAANIRLFDDDERAIQAVIGGKAIAMLAATPFPERSALRYPEKLILPVEGWFQRESQGFAIRSGDIDSLNVLNNWILIHLENGWLQERYDYWFTGWK